MHDDACVDFLQWALPRLGLRWRGFRNLRRQVCRNIAARIAALELADVAAYRALLERDPGEWRALEGLCRVTISRFWRDSAIWEALADVVLPSLTASASARGARALRAWSAGCASGEEPYTLLLLHTYGLKDSSLPLELIATDRDEVLLARAAHACYAEGTLRDLPAALKSAGFERSGDAREPLCLRPALRGRVRFLEQDLRREQPDGPFDLVFCRNVAFTYFDEAAQRAVLARMHSLLVPGGALVIGGHEKLPEATPTTLTSWVPPSIFRRDD